jgi:tRNA splicing endonuclease
MTLAETARVINMTRANDMVIKEDHLVTAFQEQGRVYEYAVKSQHNVAEGIFNYYAHCKANLIIKVFDEIATYFEEGNFTVLKMVKVQELADMVFDKLEVHPSATDKRDFMYQVFEGRGYVIKTGSKRPKLGPSKHPAIMRMGAKPGDYRPSFEGNLEEQAEYIYKQVK